MYLEEIRERTLIKFVNGGERVNALHTIPFLQPIIIQEMEWGYVDFYPLPFINKVFTQPILLRTSGISRRRCVADSLSVASES